MHEQGGFRVNEYSDANWANNPDNGTSTSSYITMMCHGAMSFKAGNHGQLSYGSVIRGGSTGNGGDSVLPEYDNEAGFQGGAAAAAAVVR